MSLPGPEVSGPTAANDATCTHDAVTLALAKQESTELLIGMATIYQSFRSKPLTITAYPVDHKHTPNPDPSFYETIKTVHFVRHGQGFHNLLADKAAASGLHWEQFDDTPENPYMAPELTDAPLTEKGRQQALHLRENQEPIQSTTTYCSQSQLSRTSNRPSCLCGFFYKSSFHRS
jgi:hypothetical protein